MNKYIIGLAVAVALLVGGYYLGKGQKEVITEEKIVYKEGETKIIEREIIKEKIIRPDGTIEERTIEKDKSTEEKSKEIEREKSQSVTPILSRYSLGAKYWPDLSIRQQWNKDNLEITTGYRVWGEAWVDVGYKLDNSVSLGLSLKF